MGENDSRMSHRNGWILIELTDESIVAVSISRQLLMWRPAAGMIDSSNIYGSRVVQLVE